MMEDFHLNLLGAPVDHIGPHFPKIVTDFESASFTVSTCVQPLGV